MKSLPPPAQRSVRDCLYQGREDGTVQESAHSGRDCEGGCASQAYRSLFLPGDRRHLREKRKLGQSDILSGETKTCERMMKYEIKL